MFFSKLLLASLPIFCFAVLAIGATLPHSEVEALRGIAKTLGKKGWNFSVDPCSGLPGWTDPNSGALNDVTCNCSFAGAIVCHVTGISLESQNLQGTLPADLSGLPFLKDIDLTFNYLYGTIPPEWGSTQLEVISLSGNRLTGSIPKELGNISTLLELVVEMNQLSGELPSELANLSSMRRLLFSSNYFTGQLPYTFSKLTTLRDFRISDNNFTGQIPDLIQNWISIQKLIVQGSGLSGPIPFGINLLGNMTDLRISDLISGIEIPFPPLSNMANLKILVLRSCNIVGQLPVSLGATTNLKVLDISFNKLNGEIPSNISSETKADYIYLTGNQLTGIVPDWLKNKENVDLSYNNFIAQDSCQEQNMNLFGSSLIGNLSATISCLRSYPCPKYFYSFHINCGGKEAMMNGNTYEEDIDLGGPSRVYQSRTNWAFSSTGHFLDDNHSIDLYISTTNTFIENSTLYMNARLSPLSLTYYGFCMGNGNYTVSLHFAEIMFAIDNTYGSLGRRIFDIYVQGKCVWKDFNIAKEAGGVDKAVIRNSTTIVTNHTLEIRFYWSGKGTTAIPSKGVYGPLISAISVTPNFTPPSESGSNMSTGILVGISIAIVGFILLALGVLYWKGYITYNTTLTIGVLWRQDHLTYNDTIDQGLKGVDLQTSSFTLSQIKAATNNFSPENKIGEGGFGLVYKGLLSDGTIIAVKQLSSKSKQGNREFVNEIGMISAIQHPHLVKLYGCCIEGNQLLLIYEYMENNSLARALYGPQECQLNLDWPTRHQICIGIARGLAFLHEESRLKIVHRDIKTTNVLLDKNLNPKISDFGLAKLNEEENTHISTRIAGTYGYMSPEYAMRGHLTDKADVYSYGIVVLEIISGRSNTTYRLNSKENYVYLLDWALYLKDKGSLLELVDPRIGSNYNEAHMIEVINMALQCTSVSPTARPAMSSVVNMLEGKTLVQDLILESTSSFDEMKIKAMRKFFQWDNSQKGSESLSKSISMDIPQTSSTFAQDLYPIAFDFDYLENRN